jgi:hypothetical protein
MAKVLDLDGVIFGEWTATNEIVYVNGRACRVCYCSCTTKGIVMTSNLTKGLSTCCDICRVNKQRKREGDSKSVEYKGLYTSWKNMIARCYNTNDKSFMYYGAKGVEVDSIFKEYSLFKEWSLANGWRKGLVISRNKDIGNYTPNNVVWITRSANSTESGLRPKVNIRKLSADAVRDIRSLTITRGVGGIKLQDISDKYGVSIAQLKAIRNNKSYKDII